MLKMPINLNIEGKVDYRSSCGGGMSIIGFTVLIIFSVTQLTKYFQQELLQVTTATSDAVDREPLDIKFFDFQVLPFINVYSLNEGKELSSNDIFKVVTPVLEVF